MGRLAAFIEDVVRVRREAGLRTAVGLVRSRVFARSETLLYELRPTDVVQGLPADWRVMEIHSAEDRAGIDALCRAGGGKELRNFRRGGISFVLCIKDEPVAHGWKFPRNALAHRLGVGATYFGYFLVRPEWRGQGIQAWLNTYMVERLPMGSWAIMEVLPSNIASQKGLAKCGCVFRGRLHTVVFLGQLVRVRIDASLPLDSPTPQAVIAKPSKGHSPLCGFPIPCARRSARVQTKVGR